MAVEESHDDLASVDSNFRIIPSLISAARTSAGWNVVARGCGEHVERQRQAFGPAEGVRPRMMFPATFAEAARPHAG
jgi:hypothetical protein